MNRREFCLQAALVAAGTSALASQVAAIEQLYDINTRHLGEGPGLIRLNDLFLGGKAGRSWPVVIDLFDDERLLHSIAINAFGGLFRFAPSPDEPFFTTRARLRWDVTKPSDAYEHTDDALHGTVHYTDSNFRFYAARLNFITGRLDDVELV